MKPRKTAPAILTETFLCLVYFEPSIFARMTSEEKRTLDRDSLAYDKLLKRSGHLIRAQALQSVDTAQCVRVRRNKATTTDGPFAETKEVLGGFILIRARNTRDALRVAAGIPLAKLGTIEVRPIYDIPRD